MTVITEDMERLREALGHLLDESVAIEQRLDSIVEDGGRHRVKGLGKAVLTPILLVAFPDSYGVWNSTAESGLKRLGLWPSFERGDSFGHRYARINRVLTDLRDQLGVDFWVLDDLWWRAEKAMTAGADLPELLDELPEDVLAAQPVLAELTFSLERHLHDFLRDNWAKTELGIEWDLLEEGGEVVGYEYPTTVGRIDLLARHRTEPRWPVIELKRDRTSDRTVGQVLRYVGWVQEELAGEGETVEGLVISHSGDDRVRYALSSVPTVSFKTYQVDFRLTDG